MGKAPQEPTAAAKADPETLVLRGRPRPVVRVKRGAVIAIAATASLLVLGTAMVALSPPDLSGLRVPPGPVRPGAATPDALADAPRSYEEVPLLGPPLPGDLGGPILRRERALAEDADAAMASESAPPGEPDEAEAALRSPILAAAARSPQPRDDVVATGPGVDPEPDVGSPAGLAPPRDATGGHRLQRPASAHVLSAGSIISAALVTGLNSDVPGLATAQVTEPVFDTPTGRAVLIPQGARLIGTYEGDIGYGQERAAVAWERIVFPDGSSIQLDEVMAADATGQAGLRDEVDTHGWKLLKGVLLSTILGVGTELSLEGESDLVEAVREAAQGSGREAGQEIVRRSLDVEPTLRIRPGWPVRAVLRRDLVLPPWESH